MNMEHQEPAPMQPLNGYTYVYSLPRGLVTLQPNATCVVVRTTHEDLRPGMTVVVDIVNKDFRRFVENGLQIFIIPNESVLLVCE